jgi:hypothetical protein
MAALLFGLLLLLVVNVASGRRPASELRHVKSPELLGPGGPDDPDR